MITMEELLALMVRQGGSDLHLSVASPPRIRVDGLLLPVETAALTAEDTRRLATSILDTDQIAKLDRDLELDCSFGLEGHGRFRANVFHQQGAAACVLRSIPSVYAKGTERLPSITGWIPHNNIMMEFVQSNFGYFNSHILTQLWNIPVVWCCPVVDGMLDQTKMVTE
mgnify:CR=1 FL=1